MSIKWSRALILIASTLCFSQTYAVPVPVYGNTYEIPGAGSEPTATDFDISTAVRRQIAAIPSLLLANPRVISKDGVVSFEGKVSDVNQAKQFVDIALATPNVTDIDISRLIDQDGNKIPNDIVIIARVKLRFVKEKLFGNATTTNLPVSVQTANVIYLSGTVDNKAQALRAIEAAKSIPGVAKVEAKFTVITPPGTLEAGS